MKKSRAERRAFLDRIEKKYKQKLESLNYKARSDEEWLSQQLASINGSRVDRMLDDSELLDLPNYKFTAS